MRTPPVLDQLEQTPTPVCITRWRCCCPMRPYAWLEGIHSVARTSRTWRYINHHTCLPPEMATRPWQHGPRSAARQQILHTETRLHCSHPTQRPLAPPYCCATPDHRAVSI